MVIAQVLLVIGSSIFLVLGNLHLYYTFFSSKFQPRNPAVENEMSSTSPNITKQTTMWRAWIGFNASHSLGAIFFGAVNLVLSLSLFHVFQQSVFLPVIILSTLLFYLFLARNYWFRIPFIGILLANLCFITAFIIMYR